MTELRWDGKYDAEGRRVAPLRLALPFQTVETVNESAADRQRTLDLFTAGRRMDWRNRLIWGDKKYVLPSLLPEFAGKVNLIYIDPPFDTGANFSFTTTVPESETAFVKEPSVIEQKAYRDTWGRGLDSYLKWFYETAVLLRELLADTGSLYVHLDWHVGHYAKVVLDEVFGYENFRNEIVWKRSNPKSHITVNYSTCTDTILYYAKTSACLYRQPYEIHDKEYLETAYKHYDEKGKYRLLPLLNPNQNRPNLTYEFLGVTRVWRWTKARMQDAYDAGLVVQTKPGAVPQYKKYLEDSKGRTITNCWLDITQAAGYESIGYPTQKPEALLERIVKASSNEGDLVLDCFCGSGTTAAVAEKLGRRWITCDLGRFAIHTTRKRMLSIEGIRPFVVQNLGKYERQLWQQVEFGERAAEVQTQYRHFLLDLYRARPLAGDPWLHGVRNGRLVHVGAVDSPVTAADLAQIAVAFRRRMGTGPEAPATTGIDVLGWDFAFEMNEEARRQAQAAGLDVRFLKIPREVLERKAVEQGDIRFFELAALTLDVQTQGRTVTLRLTDFILPLDDIPADVQQAITSWDQWIDYWAIDWDYRGDTFHNQWQSYRTRKQPRLTLQAACTYEQPGAYTLVVKVIDLLGNDTTRQVRIVVA
jgi:DNA modification methylase